MTLDDFFRDVYLPAMGHLRENTVQGYTSAWARHVSPALGDRELSSLTRYDIEHWRSSIERTGAARKAFAVLRAVIHKAVDWGHLQADPTAGVGNPRHMRRQPRVLSAAGVRDLLRAFRGHELEPLVLVMATCGLRRGEALGLTWRDLDLRSGEVRVERTRQSVAGREAVLPVKTELSARTAYLPRFAVERLREIKGRPDEWICPLHPDKAYRTYRAACGKLGLPYVPLSNLRHTYATTSLAAGNDLAIVSKMLGHTDITTTARYYLVPDKRLMQKAQKVWERFILG